MISLRPYQDNDVARLREALRHVRRVCYQLPTGGGKTCTFAYILQRVEASGHTGLVLVHRRELIRQTVAKLKLFGVRPGVVANGWPADPARPIQVASIDTLARRLNRLPKAKLVIPDECHHANADTWARVLSGYPDAKIIGCTATPCRLDGKGLRDHFDDLVTGPSIAELTEQGWLAAAKVWTQPEPDLSGVKKRAGDFALNELAERMSDSALVGDVIAHYRQHADRQPAIAFACTVLHAEILADRFKAAGYRAASVDGTLANGERDQRINGLADGSLDVLTSCALVSEGLDVPDVRAAILCRPTASVGLFLQQVGRCLRPKADGGPAIVLDHSGNCRRHGHPAEERVWSLDARPKRPHEVAEEKEREERERNPIPDEDDGELIELSASTITASEARALPLKRALAMCDTPSDIRALGRARGYAPGWARRIIAFREGRAAA